MKRRDFLAGWLFGACFKSPQRKVVATVNRPLQRVVNPDGSLTLHPVSCEQVDIASGRVDAGIEWIKA